jgi:hypothetical protein
MGTTRPKLPGVTEIFTEYVRRRQNGNTPKEAINFLRPVLQRLRSDARQQLVALLRSWESREGSRYQPAKSQASPFGDIGDIIEKSATSEDLSWLPENPTTREVPNLAQSPGQLNVNGPVHPSLGQERVNIPQNEVFFCASCGRANRLGDAYCYSCGAVLDATGVQTRDLEPGDSDLLQVGQSHFSQTSVLLLHVRGANQPIYVRFNERPEVIVGRTSLQTATRPDIDLSPYQAVDLGVSRVHARIRFEDNTIRLTDLGSVNHTYVNGQRLHAQEIRVLRDGDEIRLGRLPVQVTFHHSVNRLR